MYRYYGARRHFASAFVENITEHGDTLALKIIIGLVVAAVCVRIANGGTHDAVRVGRRAGTPRTWSTRYTLVSGKKK